jgi:uncharacterized OsmC-like protein/fermentation-respiration switch protein FrsA (DUF1100 family)
VTEDSPPAGSRTPGARSERFTFEGSTGDQLAGRLELPAGKARAFALFAHCFTCSKDSLAATRIARGLVERGIGVLRFDFTGLGSSEGDFANTNFSSNVEDVVHAAAALRRDHDGPLILIGHSLGGAAVVAGAAEIPEAVAVVTINAPADPAHIVSKLPAEALSELEDADEVRVEIGDRPFSIRRQFLIDADAQELERGIRTLGKALLVFHAPKDDVVGIDHARRIFEAARHPKSFITLHDADHLLTAPADSAYVADVVAAWATRYLDPPPSKPKDATSDGTAARDEGVVEVAEASPGPVAQEIRAGRHTIRSDEPKGVGGDTGATPYDLLLAALGACTSMTIRMYAERKEWPLERVSVHLSHDRVHSEDCEDCESGAGMVDRIERTIDLTGQLSAEQRERLLQIAEKCPVHRTLTEGGHIVTRLSDSPAETDDAQDRPQEEG